ncbi:hypothetical protein K474DRAFT_1667067 [Panus rudis PR-1116 ss-1]|nr:hypothetical protein K474DRAFT_1667067 [Panus rudis PR-1116 ss-1]
MDVDVKVEGTNPDEIVIDDDEFDGPSNPSSDTQPQIQLPSQPQPVAVPSVPLPATSAAPSAVPTPAPATLNGEAVHYSPVHQSRKSIREPSVKSNRHSWAHAYICSLMGLSGGPSTVSHFLPLSFSQGPSVWLGLETFASVRLLIIRPTARLEKTRKYPFEARFQFWPFLACTVCPFAVARIVNSQSRTIVHQYPTPVPTLWPRNDCERQNSLQNQRVLVTSSSPNSTEALTFTLQSPNSRGHRIA